MRMEEVEQGKAFFPVVEVLMSTYNGELYVEQQIESILEQNDVDVHLTIRDDGSTDDTVNIIHQLQDRFSGRIALYTGENMGYRRSFLRLITLAVSADYYAFSDQDDVWLKDKLKRAIECIGNEVNDKVLYASSAIITNEKLEEIGVHSICNMPNNIESFFSRARIGGCCFVFTRELKRIVEKFANIDYPNNQMPDHDFVVGACAYACGKVILDDNAYIYHRRLDKSVTSGGNGLRKRIKTEWNIVFRRKNIRYTMAQLLLDKCTEEITEEPKKFLLKVCKYRNSWKDKKALLCEKNMKTNLPVCDMETKFKIIIGNY